MSHTPTGIGMRGDDSIEQRAMRPAAPWWRRLLVMLLRMLAVSLLLSGLTYGYYRYQAESARQAALKELDDSDPNWRWEAIQASRKPVPEEQNALNEVRRLHELLPKNWPTPGTGKPPPHDFIDRLVNQRLTAEQREELTGYLEAEGVPAAREQARGLIRWPQGRIDAEMNMQSPMDTLLTDHARLRTIAWLLLYDALDRAERGEREEAIASIGAIYIVSHTLDEDPFLIGQLIRMSIILHANTATQRVLALGTLRDDTLAALQGEIRHQIADRRILLALRTERWSTVHTLQQLVDGTLVISSLSGGRGGDGYGGLVDRYMSERARFDIPETIRVSSQMAKIAGLPFPQQFEAEADYNKQVARSTSLHVRLFMSHLPRITESVRRHLCATTAMHALLGVERYRLRHGKWPAKLDDCVPAYLDKVPLDPIDEAPLRYKILPEGVVVYSLGNNRTDDGGDIERMQKDFGYRLWNPDQRGLAPPKLPPDPELPEVPAP